MKSKTRVIICGKINKGIASLPMMLIITATLTTIHSVSLLQPPFASGHKKQIWPISTPLPAANSVHDRHLAPDAFMARRESVALASEDTQGKYTAAWQVNTAGQLIRPRRTILPSAIKTHTELQGLLPEGKDESGLLETMKASDRHRSAPTKLALPMSGYREDQNSNLKFNVGSAGVVGFKSNFRSLSRSERDAVTKDEQTKQVNEPDHSKHSASDAFKQRKDQLLTTGRFSHNSDKLEKRLGLFKGHRYNNSPPTTYLSVGQPDLAKRDCLGCLSSAGLVSPMDSVWIPDLDFKQYPMLQTQNNIATLTSSNGSRRKIRLHKFKLQRPIAASAESHYIQNYHLASKLRLPIFSPRPPTGLFAMNRQPYNCIARRALINNRLLSISDPSSQASSSIAEINLMPQMDLSDV